MKLITRFSFLLLPAIILTGCGYITAKTGIQDRDTAYLSAKSTPPLRVPPGVKNDAFKSYYPVSDRQYSDAEKKISLVPPGLN